MARIPKIATTCDHCNNEFPEDQLSTFPGGTRIGHTSFAQGAMLCAGCIGKLAGTRPVVEEHVVYVDREPSRGGGGGATGRPFPTRAPLVSAWGTMPSSDWSTPRPSSGSPHGSSRGPGKSPSGSAARSSLLGRLLTCLTPGT